jgi:cation transporter-like permease
MAWRRQKRALRQAHQDLKRVIRDFWGVVRRQAKRDGTAAQRLGHYGLHVNGRQPRLSEVGSTIHWATQIMEGEAQAVANGFTAVANPGVAEMEAAMVAASIVGLFEGTLHEIIALVTFMPVVAGVGGNGATQTATVIIRAIALGELEFSSAWKAVMKQVLVNIYIALAAGGVIALAAVLWKGNPFLGLVLASAMILNLGLMAGFSGAVIPMVLKALKFDPAMGAGIIVTGLTDAFGFFSFLGLATLFRAYLR